MRNAFRITGFSRIVCSLVALLALLCVCGCRASELSPLSAVSRPYLALYDCERMRLGETDLLADFSHVSLELRAKGFVYTAETADGTLLKEEGAYGYDEAAGTLTLFSRRGAFRARLEDGEIVLVKQYGDRIFYALFRS